MKFHLTYETGFSFGNFRQNINPAQINDNIDCFHIVQAYQIINERFRKQVYYPKSDGALRGVPAEGVADKQQSVATCLGARGKPSPLNRNALGFL